MLAVPLPEFFGVSALEEDAADAGDSFGWQGRILMKHATQIDTQPEAKRACDEQ